MISTIEKDELVFFSISQARLDDGVWYSLPSAKMVEIKSHGL